MVPDFNQLLDPNEGQSEDTLQELTGVIPRPPLRDRMTVVDKVYHQPQNGDAYCCETTFERWLNDEESVYSRKIKVGSEWKLLHLGWFTDDSKPVGMLVMRNNEGTHLQALLSDEEKDQLSKRVLEVGVSIGDRDEFVPVFLVPPGESNRVVPSATPLCVRCLGGECSFTVFAFPR